MALLRIVLVFLVVLAGLQRAERAVVERSMSSLSPPYLPHWTRAMVIIPPPVPPPPPPPDPADPLGEFP